MIGMLPGVILAWIFKEHLLAFLQRPFQTAMENLGFVPELNMPSPMSMFVAYIKIALLGGILFSAPWVFYQIWTFIAPGLYRREKRVALPFVFFSTLCFGTGVVFGYVIVFPMVFETLLSFAGDLPGGAQVQPEIMIDDYLSITLRLIIAFGVVFEVPVVVCFLTVVGLVNWKILLKFGRWWIAISTVLAALLTPPDIASQLVMLVPLVTLYYLSIFFSYLIGRFQKKNAGVSAEA
jgi:sec-independent protein translocase protein TatC